MRIRMRPFPVVSSAPSTARLNAYDAYPLNTSAEAGTLLQSTRIGLQLQLLKQEQETLKRLIDDAIPQRMHYLA
jgi:hypothetical protein